MTKADVVHVAGLAKLKLTESEINKYLKQLSKVVDYVSELQKVDTTDVLPTSQTTGLENVFRVDEVKAGNTLGIGSALSGTENTKNDYFRVEAILKGSKSSKG